MAVYGKMIGKASCVVLLSSCSVYGALKGPPSSSAGVVEREIEREYELKPLDPDRKVPVLEIEIPEEQFDMEEGESAYISHITVSGNTVLSDRSIGDLVVKYQDQELSMRQIQELCFVLQEAYVKKGCFLAQVYPPQQEIIEGNLRLEVLEGYLGSVTVEGQKYYSEKFIRKYFAKFCGKAVNYDDLLRSLFLLNENSDLQVSAVFKKGLETGTVDLIIRVQDARPCHLYIDQNNYGAHNTTIWRTGSQFKYGNLFTDGDTLSITEVVGNPVSALNYTNASYSIPVNTLGTELKLGYLYSSFHVREFKELGLRGRTQIGSIEVNQALTRSKTVSTDVYLGFDYKQLQNYQENKTTAYDKLRVFTFGFTFDGMDRLRGRNRGDLYYTLGIPHFLGGLHSESEEASRGGSGGNFSILNIDYTRLQTLPADCFILLHASGQATPYKLPVSEQLYIGGIDTVRGYPMSAALGDDGYYLNLEFRGPIPGLREGRVPGMKKSWKDFLQWIAFADNGGVILNGGGENQKRHIMLTSAGVGLRIFAPYVNVNFDVGFPLTEQDKKSSPVYYLRVGVQPF